MKATAAYTASFCTEVCRVWQKAWETGSLPVKHYTTMAALLHDCGFMLRSSKNASAEPSASTHRQGGEGGQPQQPQRLRRMTKLVQTLLLSFCVNTFAFFWARALRVQLTIMGLGV